MFAHLKVQYKKLLNRTTRSTVRQQIILWLSVVILLGQSSLSTLAQDNINAAQHAFLPLIAAANPTASATVQAAGSSDFVVYDNGLAAGWSYQAWNNAMVNMTDTTQAHSANYSISVIPNQAWGALSLLAPSNIPVAGNYTAISFWVYSVGLPMLVEIYQDYNYNAATDRAVTLNPPVGWTPVVLNLSNLGNPSTLRRLNFKDGTGAAQSTTFYIDDITLLGGGSAGNTVTIDASSQTTQIDPRLLGSNLPAWLHPSGLSNVILQARTKASGVTVLRMPGGSWANDYGWLSCENQVYQTGASLPCGKYSGNSTWDYKGNSTSPNPNDWVARPTDFINFLKATGTQGMWTVSANSTAQEAAALVAFFNAQVGDTTYIGPDSKGMNWQTAGTWAGLRDAHGNHDPIGIKLWNFGNEVYASSTGTDCVSNWGWESTWTCNGQEYVTGAFGHAGFNEFRNAMRKVDPTIQVGAVGTVPDTYYPPTIDQNWRPDVLAATKITNSMDFYEIHQYAYDKAPSAYPTPLTYATLLAQPQNIWPTIMTNLRADFTTYAGRQVPIGVTEYNLFAGAETNDTGQWTTQAVNALFLADSIGQMAKNGIPIANQWDLANGHQGKPTGSEYGLLDPDNGFTRSPSYFVYPLWSRFGGELFPTTSTLDPATQLSVYGGRSAPNTYSLLAINKTSSPISADLKINVAGAPLIITGGTVDIVAGSNSQLNDTQATFNHVLGGSVADNLSNAPSLPFTGTGATPNYTFAPNSVTLLRLQTTPPLPTDLWADDTPYDYQSVPSNVDTGVEPSTVQEIYKSRAIWVRNDATSGLYNDYRDHQNPEFGQTNYIHVKLQNRGPNPAYATKVEVYWANASTGLAWPNQWHQAGAATIPVLNAGADAEIAVAWIPAGTGHYCLVARIVSDQDPMHSPEGNNIADNTWQNNNIVWRNVNIVDLVANAHRQTQLIVRNIAEGGAPVDLLFEEHEGFIKQGGGLVVDLGGPLFTKWKEAGGRGENIQLIDGSTQIKLLGTPALIAGLKLEKDEEHLVSVDLEALEPMQCQYEEDKACHFHLDVVQLENKKRVGGVAYDISTRTQDTDTDGDGIPDIKDEDDDNDGIPDKEDAYPLQPNEKSGDLGDAPDSTNNFDRKMLTYGGSVAAMFPTTYRDRIDPGPYHHNASEVAWLGKAVSLEEEADRGWDPDPTNNLIPTANIADLDQADDGVHLPFELPQCDFTKFEYDVNARTPIEGWHLNAWIDYNQDGDWNDIFQCEGPNGVIEVPEWIVQNAVVNAKDGYTTLTSPAFAAMALPKPELGSWLRVTLAPEEAPPSEETGIPNGRGPVDGYKAGETEDYDLPTTMREKIDARPVEKAVVTSLEKAGAETKEEANAELVKKVFASDGKAQLAEAVAASTSAPQAKYGFNIYVQCWGDGHIHIRAFDDYGHFYYLSDSVFGDIATSIECSGGEWSVKVW
ncbi:MAG: GEVED domain-containing protein [Caldilineaceae bacterium]